MHRNTFVLVVLSATVSLGREFRVAEAFKVTDAPACMPALTRTPGGDLIVAFSTEWEPFPWGGVLKTVRSTDEGRTWSAPTVIWDDVDPRVTIQVSNGLQTLSNGEILLPVTYCLVPKHENVQTSPRRWSDIYNVNDPGYRREVRLLRSRDDGHTWTIEDPKLDKPWWRFGRLLETRDGRLIMPGSGWYIESRDFGRTWGPKVDLQPAYRSETNIVAATDDRFFTIMRQKGAHLGIVRHFASCVSPDGGKTWSEWRWTGVQGKMPDLLVMPSGRILMVVGAEGLEDGSEMRNYPERHSFVTLFISVDHGESWVRDVPFVPADPGSGIVPADSPVMCPLTNGRILVVMQGIDRHCPQRVDGGAGPCMSLIGNIIEPTAGRPATVADQAGPAANRLPPPASPAWKYDVDVLQGRDFSVRTPQAMDRLYCDDKGWLWAKVAFTWPDTLRNTDQYTPRAKGGVILSKDLGLTWELTEQRWPFSSDDSSTLADGTIIETGSNWWERHLRSEIQRLKDRGYRVWDLGEKEGYCAIIYDMWSRRSTDGGKTWVTTAVHEQIGFFAAFVTRGIQRMLDDGTIVAFCYGQRKPDDPRSAYIVRSTDRGDTWEIVLIADGRLSPAPGGFTETFPLVYPDGRMMVLVRSELANYAYVVRSFDGGKTWTKPEETPMRSKHVIPTLLRDGTVVVGYQRRFKPNGYRARFTSDLGKNWSEEVVIRDNFEFEDGTRWPLTVELPDGTLYTLMTGLKFGDDGERRLYVCGSRWSRDYRRTIMPELPKPPRNPVINAEKAGKSPWK